MARISYRTRHIGLASEPPTGDNAPATLWLKAPDLMAEGSAGLRCSAALVISAAFRIVRADPTACRKPTAMKKDIHPDYHDITVVMTDGTELPMRSTYGSPGQSLRLDIDIKTHPAWTGVQRLNESGGQVAKFNKRFAGLGIKK